MSGDSWPQTSERSRLGTGITAWWPASWPRLLLLASTLLLLPLPIGAQEAEPLIVSARSRSEAIELRWEVPDTLPIQSLALQRKSGLPVAAGRLVALLLFAAGLGLVLLRKRRAAGAPIVLAGLALLVPLVQAAVLLPLSPEDRSYLDEEVDLGNLYSYRLLVNDGEAVSPWVTRTQYVCNSPLPLAITFSSRMVSQELFPAACNNSAVSWDT